MNMSNFFDNYVISFILVYDSEYMSIYNYLCF